jgi:hypothetical protein
MKLVNFLKTRAKPILIVLGITFFLIAAIFINTTMADRRDIAAAQDAGRNAFLAVQNEMLTQLSYVGGTTVRMTPEIARQTMEESLQSIVDTNNADVSELQTDINNASMDGGERALKQKIMANYESASGIYGSMDQAQYEDALKKPKAAAEDMMHEFTRAATDSQSLMDMYKSRMDWLTSNSEMSSTEIFELARQSKANLFNLLFPTFDFMIVLENLGLDTRGLRNLEQVRNLKREGPLDDVAGDDFKSVKVLIDSLGSFFNACTKC